MATAYEYIAENNRRTFLVVGFFVALVLVSVWWLSFSFALAHYSRPPGESQTYNQYITKIVAKRIVDIATAMPGETIEEEEIEWLAPDVYPQAKTFAWRATGFVGLLILWILLFPPLLMEVMVLNSSHSQLLKLEEYRELYRIAGTVYMTAGLPTPKIYLIADDSLNAFSVGLTPQRACLVVTKGLLNKLSRPELEAVIAHEAAHVLYGDTRVMLVAVYSVLLFRFLAESFWVTALYSVRRNVLAVIFLWILGAASSVLGLIFAPLGRLAISYECEARADARGALLCRNPGALARALKKIAEDPYVEILDNHPSMIAMCIYNPRREINLFLAMAGLWDTHPPLYTRVRALEDMDRDVLKQ